MFLLKMDCYRLHYYLMNNDMESNLLKPYYNIVFNKYFSSAVYFSYFIFYYINIIVTTITYSMVFIELFTNNYTMYNSLILIPCYSLFKFLYNLVWYFECKHNALHEYYVRQHNYMLFLKSKNIISDFNFDSEALYLKYEREVIREL